MINNIIVKNHDGELMDNWKINSIKVADTTFDGRAIYIIEIILADPFDITTADIDEIIDRIEEKSNNEYFDYRYENGMLFLKNYYNMSKIADDLNLPNYLPPFITSRVKLLSDYAMTTDTGTVLNLRKLVSTISKAKRKYEVNE